MKFESPNLTQENQSENDGDIWREYQQKYKNIIPTVEGVLSKGLHESKMAHYKDKRNDEAGRREVLNQAEKMLREQGVENPLRFMKAYINFQVESISDENFRKSWTDIVDEWRV